MLVTSSDSEDDGGRRGSGIDFSNVSLRIRVEDVATGEVKLESRFPAKWMASIASVIPQLVRPSRHTTSICPNHSHICPAARLMHKYVSIYGKFAWLSACIRPRPRFHRHARGSAAC